MNAGLVETERYGPGADIGNGEPHVVTTPYPATKRDGIDFERQGTENFSIPLMINLRLPRL